MSEERIVSYIPKADHHYRVISDYIEEIPDDDFIKAPREAIEAFNDIKFAVRIHFGIYSILKLDNESWKFLDMSYEEKAKYNGLYKSFDPKNFNADEWMSLFERSGIRAMAFTTKHHEGFSLFDTKTRVKRRINWTAAGGPKIEECDLAYSIAETPFKRDMVGELCAAAKKHNIKMDLYFSHPDWYDADFAPYCYHPMKTENMRELLNDEDNNSPRYDTLVGLTAPANDQESEDRMIKRHCDQLKEILTNYGNIDMLCLDMWFGPKVWRRIKETIKEIRKIQPNTMIRSRGIGNYGDYYTPENYIPGKAGNTNMPWMVIHTLGTSFSYDADAKNYKGTKWIIENLALCAAKGGSFMVGIGPDGDGVFHPEAVRQLEATGEWLRINGGAIFDTVSYSEENYMEQHESSAVYFTMSKDKSYLYAVSVSDNLHGVTIKSAKDKDKFKTAEIFTPGGLKQIRDSDIVRKDGCVIFPKDICGKLYGAEYKHAYAFRLAL
jgi:alpha-L-fucosidase